MLARIATLAVLNIVAMAQGPGSFAGEYKDAEISLQLAGSGDQYSGTLQYQGASLPVRAGARGNELEGTFRLETQEFAFRLKRDGSAVILTTDGTSYRLEPVAKTRANPLARGPAAAAPTPTKERGLEGAWRNAQGIMRFQPDGSGVAAGAPFRYQVAGNAVTMTSAEGTIRLTYAIEGNTLRLIGPTGQVALERVKEESGEGRVVSDLAGKWCYVSNVNATGGGARSSNACFSLSPDGRYEYSGETDSYNKFGGATSQSSDRGTWTATETSITARSASGRVTTYVLEKRNHPKNNDPMLVLDGQAFVTFYQKPPWR